MIYTKKAADKDSTYAAVQSIMGVTSEVVTGNHITLKQDPQIAQDTTERKVYLQAPAGLNLQLYLPIRQVVESFENAVSASSAQGIINSMTLTVPVSPISNTYGVEPPKFLLFVRKSEMQTFFEKKLLADNVNTFYAMYDEENKCYSFSKLNTYINHIIEQKRAGIEITEADEEIMLVPVSVYTETVSSGSSYYYYSYTEEEVITDIVPYIEAPAMGVVDTENIKFQLTYSKQQGIE